MVDSIVTANLAGRGSHNRNSCVCYNRVVCVGGDGMFGEILHGLIGRTQQESGLCENDPAVTLQPCPLHIGIIPAGNNAFIKNPCADWSWSCSCVTHIHIVSLVGSTDCVCYATVGVIDPVTSALHIIIGE